MNTLKTQIDNYLNYCNVQKRLDKKHKRHIKGSNLPPENFSIFVLLPDQKEEHIKNYFPYHLAKPAINIL